VAQVASSCSAAAYAPRYCARAQHVLAGAGHPSLTDRLVGERQRLVQAVEHLEQPHPLEKRRQTALPFDLGQTRGALDRIHLLAKSL
jgi:hypothetical protein